MKTINKIWLVLNVLFSQTRTKLHAEILFCVSLFLVLSPYSASSQIDSRGTDFWVMFTQTLPEDPFGDPPRSIDLQIFISSIPGASGSVEISAIGFNEDFTVGANSLITVEIPDEGMMTGDNTTSDRGIHITSDNPVTVYGLNQRTFTTDAYLSIPINGWDTDYRIMAFGQENFNNGSQMGIVAGTDGTVVTITPSTAIGFNPAFLPFQITLDEGETYQARTGPFADLTGTLVTANQPIGVFGGHYCGQVPLGIQACDHLVEMLPPVSTWGQSFVTTPFAGRENGDIFRVLASEDNTTVTLNGALVETLNAGEFYETNLEDPASIQTSNPALLAQYMQGTAIDGPDFPGDPAMVIVAPVEQFLGNYTVSTPATGFETNHLNIVVDNNGIGSILLNGSAIDATEFTAIAGTNFNSAQIAIELGTYTLTSSTAFGVLVYGANYSDSYAYPGGQLYSNVVSVNNLTLAPGASEGPAFSQLCFTATLATENGDPIEGVRIDFTASGANTASGFAFTNAEGVATYCYTAENTGNDVLTAFQGDLSENVNVTWTEPTYDCLGVPNGTALANTPCEVDGQTGTWNIDCNCDVELQACGIEIISASDINHPCIDGFPLIDGELNLYNPNNETELTVYIDYIFNDDYEDEVLILPVSEGNENMLFQIPLVGYGMTVDITFQLGEGENACQASLAEMNFAIPGCIPDCEGILGGSANPGTPCLINGQAGEYSSECACEPLEPGTCINFNYYLADILPNGTTNIYSVAMNDTDAELSLITTSDIEVHIAYNEDDKFIYAVSKADGSYRTFDPIGASWSEVTMINGAVSGITGAAFNASGNLLIASQSDNTIYRVELGTNDVFFYNGDLTITGGDISAGPDGKVYLASRNMGGSLYLVGPFVEDEYLGSTPEKVTGLCASQDGNMLMSSNGATTIFWRNLDDTVNGQYNLLLNGQPFTSHYGDMASGCGDDDPGIESCYGADNGVLEYLPGLQSNGQPITDPERNSPLKALGAPQIDDTYNFVSLGYGGSITLGFEAGVALNGPGDDILVVETTFGAGADFESYPEAAEVFVSQDGFTFYSVGSVYTDEEATFDIDASGQDFEYIVAVRLVDTTPIGSVSTDGFDLDGIESMNGCGPIPVSQIGTCYASEMIDYAPGLQTNGHPIAAERTDPSTALNAPDQSNAPGGFVSLGVGGSITLGFNGNVMDGDGDDLLIFETSYNGDNCSGAGDERADIAVSQDGITFVEMGTICRDGGVDISGSGLAYVSQVRITNAATTTSLDGYDVDGVIALHNCEEVKGNVGASSGSHFATSELTSYPNPTNGLSTVVFIPAESSRASLEVFNMSSHKITTLLDEEVRGGQKYELPFDGRNLSNGVYIFRLITAKDVRTEKFIISK